MEEVSPEIIIDKVNSLLENLTNLIQNEEGNKKIQNYLNTIKKIISKIQNLNVELNIIDLKKVNTFLSYQETTSVEVGDLRTIKKHIFYIFLRFILEHLEEIQNDIVNFKQDKNLDHLNKALIHLNKIGDKKLTEKLYIYLRGTSGLEGYFLKKFLSKEKYRNYDSKKLSMLFMRFFNMYSKEKKGFSFFKDYIKNLLKFEIFSKDEIKELKRLTKLPTLSYDTIFIIQKELTKLLKDENNDYKTNEGQIRFVEYLINKYDEIKTLNLGSFCNILSEEIKNQQNWSKIDLPFDVGKKFIELKKLLEENFSDELKKLKSNDKKLPLLLIEKIELENNEIIEKIKYVFSKNYIDMLKNKEILISEIKEEEDIKIIIKILLKHTYKADISNDLPNKNKVKGKAEKNPFKKLQNEFLQKLIEETSDEKIKGFLSRLKEEGTLEEIENKILEKYLDSLDDEKKYILRQIVRRNFIKS